jgi:hypothetical protein
MIGQMRPQQKILALEEASGRARAGAISLVWWTAMSSPTSRRQLHLNAFLMTIGHHESAWRFPESSLTGTWDVQHYLHLARVAERGKFDSIFFGDGPSLQGDIRYRPVRRLDPTALLPAIAAVTQRIFRTEYTGTTLRDHYGLPRPQNQYSVRRMATARAAGE